MKRTSFQVAASAALGLLSLQSPLLAQGGDDCSAPTLLVGLGDFTYDLAGATDSGFDGGDALLCGPANGLSAPYSDVFFSWTSVKAGTYSFNTCAESTQDTALNVHLGFDCSASCIVGVDGGTCSGGPFSVDPSVAVVRYADAWDSFLIQVGRWSASDSFTTGTLTIEEVAPANDDCSTPRVISGLGRWYFDNTLATTSGFDGGGVLCSSSQSLGPPTQDVFFAWTADAAGDYVFTTCPSGLDTDINVHFGFDCSATCFDNWDSGPCSGIDDAAARLLGVNVGDQYLIQTGSWSDGSTLPVGEGEHSLLVMPDGAPTNDWCNRPDVIAGTGMWTYDNTLASTSGFIAGDSTCNPGTGSVAKDVFYQWSSIVLGDYEFTTCGTPFDTTMAIYQGLGCSATCIASNDNSPVCSASVGVASSSLTILAADPSDSYLIQTGTWSDTLPTGPTTLMVNNLVSVPSNNDCSTPTVVSGVGVFSYDNTLATQSGFDGGDSVACYSPAGTDHMHFDVFFAWTPVIDFPHVARTCNSGFDTTITVHQGSDCSATCIESNDIGFGPDCTVVSDDASSLLGPVPGAPYLIQVGTWTSDGSDTGPTDLIIELNPALNDTCESPDGLLVEGTYIINNLPATTSGFSGGTVFSGGTTDCFGPPSEIFGDLFFTYTVPCDGDYIVDTNGSPVTDTLLNVHTGADCNAVCLEGDDLDGDGFWSEVIISGATAGTTYLIQVGSFSGLELGEIYLSINRSGGPCEGDITLLCDPAGSHYAGDYVKLDSSYLGSGVGSDLHLEATDGPAGEFGFVLVANSAGAGINVFNGVLCLGSPQGRYNPQVAINQGLPQLSSIGQFDATGVLLNLAGTAGSTGGTGFDVPLELPFSPAQQVIQAADTYYFQLWYRDIDANSNPSANFSNMIEVQFP